MNAPRVAPGLEELGELLLLAPFHRWLGLRIAEVGTDELVISMPWRDEIISNPTVGAAHGGILSALIDLTGLRSEEHTSELQSLMRISYAVFCLKKKK